MLRFTIFGQSEVTRWDHVAVDGEHKRGMLSVDCESRKTQLNVPGFGDYMLLIKAEQRASKP
jgi:hypothetical protein